MESESQLLVEVIQKLDAIHEETIEIRRFAHGILIVLVAMAVFGVAITGFLLWE